MRAITRFVAVIAFAGWAGTVNASLMGTEVTLEHYYPTVDNLLHGPLNVTVSDGVECISCFYGGEDIDIGAESITWVHTGIWSDGAFNGLLVSGLDWGVPGAITDIDVLGSVVNVDFGDDWVRINVAGISSGGTIVVNLTAEHENVPAPATLALFGLGLAGLGWSRRKKA